MEFEILKRSHLKRNIIVGVLIVGIISACILTLTRAKYRTTQSIPLVNGTINYTPYDLKMIAMYQENNGDYESIDTVPTSGYILNEEKSYCEVNGVEDNNATMEYKNGRVSISINKKGTKCYLYFDEQKILAKDTILANSKVNEGTPNFANTATTDEGVYKTQDDWEDSYYFRGAVNNNWVSFAGFYWRIIRINGDGSIRIIYSGEADSATPDSTNTTGSSTMINSSQAFNSSRNRSEYVGYMYTSGQQHGNTTNSDIKTVVDNWYNSNLKSQESKISKEAGFCGDRNLKSGSWRSTGSSHDYAAYGRLIDNKTPTLKCSNSNDLYTTSSSSKGNKALTNPIGLITADEVAMAGGVYATSNSSYYLYNGEYYWTMSPYLFSAAFSSAYVFYVDSSGNFNGSDVDYTRGVRPVINLAHDVVIKSGNGTSSTPYEI